MKTLENFGFHACFMGGATLAARLPMVPFVGHFEDDALFPLYSNRLACNP
jgi:hypothetical protein